MDMELDYRKILLRELEARQGRNSSYNLSSFARFLKIPPSRFSEILRGKVGLSIAKAATICDLLHLTNTEKNLFLDLVCAEHGRNPNQKKEAIERIQKYKNAFFQYDQEHFSSIADWYHHAILEMIGLYPNISILEMSKSLNIESQIIHKALERLIKLKVIIHDNSGYKLSSENRETTRDIPSEAIKKLNEQILEKASTELKLQDVNNRDYSIIFFNFNKSQLQLAKNRIKEFRRSFMKEFESSVGKDSVYCMGMQLFELSGNESRIEKDQ